MVSSWSGSLWVSLGAEGFGVKGRERPPGAASAFLLKRGLFLVVLELTLVNFAWGFSLTPPILYLQVIWVIGLSMIALAGLAHLPRAWLIAVGLVLALGHNLLDPIAFAEGPAHVLGEPADAGEHLGAQGHVAAHEVAHLGALGGLAGVGAADDPVELTGGVRVPGGGTGQRPRTPVGPLRVRDPADADLFATTGQATAAADLPAAELVSGSGFDLVTLLLVVALLLLAFEWLLYRRGSIA